MTFHSCLLRWSLQTHLLWRFISEPANSKIERLMLRKKCRECTKNVWILAVIQCTCIASFTFVSVTMVLHCIYNTELTWLLKYSLFKYMYSFFEQICSFSISEVQGYTGNHDTLMTNKWFFKKTTNTWAICLFSTDEETRKTKLTKTPKA